MSAGQGRGLAQDQIELCVDRITADDMEPVLGIQVLDIKRRRYGRVVYSLYGGDKIDRGLVEAGCDCSASSSQGSVTGVLFLLGALAVRRRRRR